MSLWIIFLYNFSNNFLHSEIKKRVLKDGTIEYYKEKKSKSFQKYNFESPYNRLIENISKQEGLDAYLIKCLIRVESNFKADAVSVAGAMGLMQIMQEIARHYNIKDPLDPEENLTAGIKHLKFLLDYFKNDVTLALAAYHAGLGRVKKNMKIPSIESTVDYVNDIMLLYKGEKNNEAKIRRLYERISDDGVIEIYNK